MEAENIIRFVQSCAFIKASNAQRCNFSGRLYLSLNFDNGRRLWRREHYPICYKFIVLYFFNSVNCNLRNFMIYYLLHIYARSVRKIQTLKKYYGGI